MKTFPIPDNDVERVDVLRALQVLDTDPTRALDALTHAASLVCDTPIALVSLVDADRQWFKSKTGLPDDVTETPREQAFCAHAIMDDAIFEVRDAVADERFVDNPLVVDNPGIRFYAGAPLITRDGYRLGTVCVIDTKPNRLDDVQRATLRSLADVAVGVIEETKTRIDAVNWVQQTLDGIGDGLISTDVEGIVTYINPAAIATTRWDPQDAIGRPIEDILRLVDSSTHRRLPCPVRHCLATGTSTTIPAHSVLITADGGEVEIDDSVSQIIDSRGEMVGAVAIFRDVSGQRRLQRELQFQATRDALTGTLNRFEFERRLNAAIQGAQTSRQHHALLYLDLDKFKGVNDQLGHVVGDELLRRVAATLSSSLRSSDELARVGGDEFGIVMRDCTVDDAVRMAEGLVEAVQDLRTTFVDRRANVSASIGIVGIDEQTGSILDVLKHADSACHAAKQVGGSRVQVFDPDSSDIEAWSGGIRWMTAVQDALNENGLRLHAEPIVPIGSNGGELPHLEILVRLEEEGILYYPDTFMPVAERFLLASQIDEWVFAQTISVLEREPEALANIGAIHINLSAQTLGDLDTARRFGERLDESPVAAEKVCFEITESGAMADFASAALFVSELTGRGCRFALDDFGKGFSSFGYLKQFPVQIVKIDGMFITDLSTNPVTRQMTESINAICKLLGKRTVAECVESAPVIELLDEIGVDFAQGFHLARADDLTTVLRRFA